MTEKEKIHRKLRDALKVEKEFGELKSKIISNLSHEFKTPLSSIRSSAQLIKAIVERTAGDERSLKHAKKIETAVDILTDIFMRILSVEKDDKIYYHPRSIKFDLDIFFEGILKEFQLEANSQLELQCDFQKDLGLIESDQNLLRLIFINIVSNACKYSEYSGVVKVNSGIDKKSNALFFFVEDEGIGMSQEDLEQVYFRFFRGKNVGSIEGTGIGLSIVKRAVDALEGEIKIESELKGGTKVEVKIPLGPTTL